MFIFASGKLCKVWKRPNLKVISWNYKQHYYIFCGHYKKRSATKVIIRVRQKQILYILFGKSQKSNTGHRSLPKVKKQTKQIPKNKWISKLDIKVNMTNGCCENDEPLWCGYHKNQTKKKSCLFDCRIRRIPLNCVEPLHQKSVTDP